MFVGLPNALPLPVSCHLLKGGPERTYVVTQVNVLDTKVDQLRKKDLEK